MIKRSVGFLSLAVTFVSLLYVSTAIASEIIYSTFGPGQSYNTYSGQPVGTFPYSDETTNMEAAVSFSPSQSYAFDSIAVAALFSSFSTSDQFTVSLARDSGTNAPGVVVETFSFTGIIDSPTVYSASSLLHPQMTAGEKYWVVMSSDDLLSIYLQWLDTDQPITGEIASRNALYTDWVVNYADFGSVPAFEFQGTTAALPEPVSLLLLGLGIAGLAGARGRIGG
jgi:hypothetical protein